MIGPTPPGIRSPLIRLEGLQSETYESRSEGVYMGQSSNVPCVNLALFQSKKTPIVLPSSVALGTPSQKKKGECVGVVLTG